MRSAVVLLVCCLALAMLSPAQNTARPPLRLADEDKPVAARRIERRPMTVRTDVHHDVSEPLRDLMRKGPLPPREKGEAEPVRRIPLPAGLRPITEDPIRQHSTAPSTAFVGLNFDGLGQGQYWFDPNFAPPDTDGAVGGFQYVQWVNTSFAVFDKATGAMQGGVTSGYWLWSGFGGGCSQNNDGDVIVLYDKLADRWVMSQFSVSTQPYLQCVAVSTTPDVLGTWYRYSFQYSDTNDYPKMGVWPDAYYETFNMYNGDQFLGANACAYDRTAMLNGQTATQVCFQQGPSVGSLLPADVDGTTPPPPGSPNYLLTFGANSLDLFQFHVDFKNPGNSTFTGPTTINVAAFDPLCGGDTCIPQLGTTNQLDSLADRLMFRLAYRNFGSHESLVVNHSVAVNGGGGIRWYEIQNPGGTPVVAQQGTYAPDSNYRWMGSIAMDGAGDIAVGYSKSSSSLYPSIAFAGRVPNDPAGTLQSETEVINGSGSQTEQLHRWGDYSAMTVDPGDDCTFWYTQEYLQFNGAFNWNTRIVNFKYPNCIPATYILSVSKAGTGSGTVTSGDGRINCGQSCSAAYTGNSQVTLTATPAAGSDFAGWSGCNSVSGNTCTVTMYRARTATATFTYNPIYYSLSVSVNGNGTVTSTDGFINCPGTCEHSYLQRTQVTLNATPAQGWSFAGWRDIWWTCSGTGPCNVTMNGNDFVSAGFTHNLGNLTTLYSFCSQPNCSDGSQPQAGLVQGVDGNFYGTTYAGGGGLYQGGTVFRITPSGSLATLYSFCSQPNCADGETPQAALINGSDGSLYGTTYTGGANWAGTTFKVTPGGLLTTLHSFNVSDGYNLDSPLTYASDGNFYGTTLMGGTGPSCGGYGGGTVFEMTPGGALTTLYSFGSEPNCANGYWPQAGLVQGPDGNFYGTTQWGGAGYSGAIFKVTPAGAATTLHSFSGADGAQPVAGLVQGADGSFYGTTSRGGKNTDPNICISGCGTIFKITPSGSFTTVYNFCSQPNCGDGAGPEAGLVLGTDGNFYGITPRGGTATTGWGTIFQITPTGVLTTLYSFCSQANCTDGADPKGLIQAADGNFYGTTYTGGGVGQFGYGTVFKFQMSFSSLTVSPSGQGTVTSTDGFINCPGACSHSYPTDTPVTLTAVAANGWAFSNWSGCDAVQDNQCNVSMSQARNVSVAFAPTHQLTISKAGSGTINSSDGYINCGASCSYTYFAGTTVVLTATPWQGWVLTDWQGCDTQLSGTCQVIMNSDRTVTPTFAQLVELRVSTNGSGVVGSGDGHIYCGQTCSSFYPMKQQVNLTGNPAAGFVLDSWTGCDSTQGNVCTVAMAGAKNVSATFTQHPNISLKSFVLNPASVKGGNISTATITLDRAAPSGGFGVGLSSDHPQSVQPPSLVIVPAGQTSFSFAVRTTPVRTKTLATITATANSSHTSATLTLTTSYGSAHAPAQEGATAAGNTHSVTQNRNTTSKTAAQ